jgi:hypothetical protein
MTARAGATYGYRVRAADGAGTSPYSNTAYAATPESRPAAPSGLTATPISVSQIDLSWVDNSSNESEYRIERCQGASCTSFVQIATVGPDAETYSDTTVAPDKAYRYRVRAANGAGVSTASNVASATTPIAGPAAPKNLRIVRWGSCSTVTGHDAATERPRSVDGQASRKLDGFPHNITVDSIRSERRNHRLVASARGRTMGYGWCRASPEQ